MPSAPSDRAADSGVRRFEVVGIAGSLRRGSFNRALLGAALISRQQVFTLPGTIWRRCHSTTLLWTPTAAIMGASSGMSGTARCQSQIRQAFVSTNTYAMLQPEVLVRHAQEKFDAEGQLTDKATRDLLSQFLQRFEEWTDRFST
jgi:NAD(P)H-dependent FMN reductase